MSKISDSLLSAMEIIAKKVVASETTEFDRTIQAQIICKEEKGYRVKYQDSTFVAETLNTDSHEYKAAEWVYVLHSNSNNYNMILGLVPQGNPDIVDTGSGEDYVKIGNDCCLNTVNGEKEFPPFKLCSYAGIEQLYNLYEAEDAADGSITVMRDLIGIDQALAQESISNSTSLLIGAQFKSQLPIEQQEVGNYGLIVTLAYEDGNRIPYVLDVNRMQGNPYAQTSGFVDQSFIFKIDDGANFSYIKRIDFFCAGFKSATEKTAYDLFMKQPRIYGVAAASELDTYSVSVQMPNGNTFNTANAGETRKFVGVYREKGKKVSGVKYYWFKENRLVTSIETGYHAYGGKGWQLLDGSPKTELVLTGADVPVASRLYKCVAYANGIKVEKGFVVKNTAEGLPSLVIQSVENTEHQLEVTLENGGNYAAGARYEWYYIFNGVSQIISNDENNTVAQLVDSTKINYTPQTGALTFKCAYFYNNGTTEENLLTATYEVAPEFAIEEYSIVVQQGAQVFQYNEAGQAPHIYQTNFAIAPLTIKFYYKGVEQQLTENEVIWSYPNKNTLIQYAGSASPSADSVLVDRNNIYAHEFAFTLANTYDVSKAANSLVQVTIAAREGANGWPQITKDVSITFLKQGDPGTNGTGYYCNISAVGDRDYIVAGSTDKNTLQLKVQVWNSGEIVDVDANKITWSMLKGGTLTATNGLVQGTFDEANPWNVVQVKVIIGDDDGALVLYDTFPIVVTTNEAILLEPNSGYKHVVYEADGTNPSYPRVKPFTTTAGDKDNWILNPEKYQNGPPAKYLGELTPFYACYKNTLYVPIHMSLNRYAHAWLNDWDGNTLEVNSEKNYILAPQVGAGSKTDNKFTGITMGTYVREGDTQEIGLFGFSNGERSIFLNANDGSATFGKNGSGQIVIDPKISAATITGGVYKRENQAHFSTEGTQIDLTQGNIITPQFSVIEGNAYFKGNITGASGTFEGSLSGATISGGTITGATINGGSLNIDKNVNIGSGGLVIDEDGNLTLQGAITWEYTNAPSLDQVDPTDKVGTAQSAADAAEKTANSARISAISAQTIANNAQKTANDASNAASAASALSEEIKGALLNGTSIDGNSVISPYIGGGYLEIGTGPKVIINPLGLHNNLKQPFVAEDAEGNSIIEFKEDGSALFNGEIYATKGGNIGGFLVSDGPSLFAKDAEDSNKVLYIEPKGIYSGMVGAVRGAASITHDGKITSIGVEQDDNNNDIILKTELDAGSINFYSCNEKNEEILTRKSIMSIASISDYNSLLIGVDSKYIFYLGDIETKEDGQFLNPLYVCDPSQTYLNSVIGVGEPYTATHIFNGHAYFIGNIMTRGEQVYFSITPSSNSSDRNVKNSIENLFDKYEIFFDQLKPVRFKYNEGTSGRYHLGYIAQDVENALYQAGLDTTEFAGFIRRENNSLALAYTEFIALLHYKIKQLEHRIMDLETQLQS